MRIHLLAVGKIKEKYLAQGIREYLKRLQPYAKTEIIEIAEEKGQEPLSESELEHIKQKEGERILNRISPQSHVIALAIQGSPLSSEELAQQMEQLATFGTSHLTFIIGGSYGLSPDVLKRADQLLSFSRMTFPHQLMRLILLEQVYRAFKIIRGESYHK
ncbi:ribosomal RNA large subunit methyltransferase H [Marinithermofilum abyssi]|jgi:23S rRNA (pseudouridine1915-N3)-methyltransferase|uniref:Ribosomal RNA large subunit methyltransferase H n=1 Tax=Marinithermofilum abyssi TaxID=1571185 RepID=A0A8J2YBP2_9BACL|nr:23S rRNA (pseudouridine(1915)-N(3))-methyltransferase RlmH [Marinithermofilum abyssi]GGE05853.1 ribosomal RNA large subunit methyltransferase H [Marinithermofilum abyssi]